MIADIRTRFESIDPAQSSRANVVCVAHSHVLSAFALRWVGRPLEEGTRLLLDTAGVAVLRCVDPQQVELPESEKKADDGQSYDYHDLDEPAIIIGRRF